MPQKSRCDYLALAEEIVNQKPFSKENSARAEALIAMAQLVPPTIGEARIRTQQLRDDLAPGQPTDRELRRFFGGEKPEGKYFSAGEGSIALRTYTALNEGTGSQGGDAVPVGFHADVIEAMRAANGLFDAARWIFTKGVGVLNYPTSDDSSTSGDAAVLAESGAVSQGPNPIFGNFQFSRASLWSTGQFLYSVHLGGDSGINLREYFAKIFAMRFARGCSKQFVTTLLAGVSAGVTTASASTIVEAEVFEMLDSIDAAYASSPTAGWLMSLSTLRAILQVRTSGGAIPFPAQKDDEGYPLLLTKRVYICPTMPAISAGNQVAVFGDLQRFVVRSVNDTFSAVVYNERYMPNHQFATQAFWRLDGQLAIAGSSDVPMSALVMHA
jgi:HK97 family phage major capsid protein